MTTNLVPIEATVQHRIRKCCIDRGAFVIRETSSAGLPDLVVCYRGLFLGIEVKRPDPHKKYGVTPLQVRKLEQIREAGGLGFVARTAGEVEAVLDRIDWEIDRGNPRGLVNELPPIA